MIELNMIIKITTETMTATSTYFGIEQFVSYFLFNQSKVLSIKGKNVVKKKSLLVAFS